MHGGLSFCSRTEQFFCMDFGQSAFPHRVKTIYRRSMSTEVGTEVHEAKKNPLSRILYSHELFDEACGLGTRPLSY